MSPRKLTEDDKQEILQLYRNSEATTSTLANRYEVSSSTISRFLKNKLTSTEYEDLIQQKRLARTPRGENSSKKSGAAKTTKSQTKSKSKSIAVADPEIPISSSEVVDATEVAETTKAIETKTESASVSRRRRRSSAKSKPIESLPATPEVETSHSDETPAIQLETAETSSTSVAPASKSSLLVLKGDRQNIEDDDDDDEVDLITLKEMLGEDLEDINEEEDDEWDDDDDDDDDLTYSSRGSNLEDLEILPLSQAIFPHTCYLVIDRSAELIVKPLADFADLGAIPQEEIREKTLPVFDNHRIAKRFSHRRERVIKVPDGKMLQKTSRYLQDKGITRLLIDGQIYSLSN